MQVLPEIKGKPIKQENFEQSDNSLGDKIKGWDYSPNTIVSRK